MTGEKRGGGPKTLQGKARSSANAKTHGLTSKVPSNSQEKVLVETYAKELIDYKRQCYDILYEHFHGIMTNRKDLLREKASIQANRHKIEDILKTNDAFNK